ncbi:MAG: hypothetical protein JO323_10155 [Acidobacteriia bacterium]|nr:hypothetical protein [Terriglobia bacterium]
MTGDWEVAKFAELRERTDRDLIWLIDRELDMGLVCAAEADTERAEHYLAEADRLLPEVYSLSPADLDALESKLARLEEWLGGESEECRASGCCAG